MAEAAAAWLRPRLGCCLQAPRRRHGRTSVFKSALPPLPAPTGGPALIWHFIWQVSNGTATPLLRADLRLLAARALAKNDAVAAFGLAQDALLDLRRALDDEDPRVAAAAAFVVRLDRRAFGRAN